MKEKHFNIFFRGIDVSQNHLVFQYEVSEGETLKDGYILLAPGAKIAVGKVWLHSTLLSLSKKSRKLKNPENAGFDIVKRLMDAFYEPWDLCVKGGTKAFQDSNIFKSLRSK